MNKMKVFYFVSARLCFSFGFFEFIAYLLTERQAILHIFHLRVGLRYRTIYYMDAFSFVVQRVSESFRRLDLPDNVLIGLSGGADSVALLLALRTFSREHALHLSAVYINHGLRSAAAEEERFCERLCGENDIPFYVRRVHVPASGSLEASAREVRYGAFREVLSETRSDVLALAHHMDDQAETVLLHLLHGAGADGLGGMREYRPPVWRPLLGVRRDTLREALQELGQDWREDESNADPTYARNYLRAKVLPCITAAYPQATPAIARAAEILRDENDCLNAQCDAWLERFSAKRDWPFLMAAPLLEQHRAIRRRIFRAYAGRYGLALEYSHVETLEVLLESSPGAMANLPQGWRAMRTQERVHLLPPTPSVPALCIKDLRVEENAHGTGDGKTRQTVPAEILSSAVLRTRMPGDWITPFGMRGRMKLKDYMISRGVDRPFRGAWPLLCVGSEVIWVIGVGASERLRASPGDQNGRMVVYSGLLPDAL